MKETTVNMPKRIPLQALCDFAADHGCSVVTTGGGYRLKPKDPYGNVVGIGRPMRRQIPATPAPGGDAA